MDDINLGKILVDKDGKTIRLEFLDMFKGAFVGALECKGVVLMNYHNVLENEGFAAYVGEVNVEEYAGDSAREKLCELGFGFRNAHGHIYMPKCQKIYHLHVEGGEICIDLCCGEYHLYKNYCASPANLED